MVHTPAVDDYLKVVYSLAELHGSGVHGSGHVGTSALAGRLGVSASSVSGIDAKLGHPSFDPHGDPIPAEDGTLPDVSARRLSTVDPGTEARLVRVDDEDPDMLRYLADRAVALGETLTVLERRPFGGPFRVRAGGTEHEIGPALADALWVEPAS